jgi:hypothetical protein
MTNDDFLNLDICETSTVVILKDGQQHPAYYGPVRWTRKRGDYGTACEYWFLYMNTPRRCVPCASGFSEV